MTFGLILLQDEMEHQSQSLEKGKIKSLGAQQMWVTSMLANRTNRNQVHLLFEKFIFTSHNSSLSLSLLRIWMQKHIHRHTRRYRWTWLHHIYLLHVSFLGLTFGSFPSQLKHSWVLFFFLIWILSFSQRSSSWPVETVLFCIKGSVFAILRN